MNTEVKKLLATWEVEKGSFIPNAPIYAAFISELKTAIEKDETNFINNTKTRYKGKGEHSVNQLETIIEELKEEIHQIRIL